MNFLSRSEETFLLSIWKPGDNANGITIREKGDKDIGIRRLSGAIYRPLHRLKKIGSIVALPAKKTCKYSGRPGIYDHLTPRAKEKLASSPAASRALWAGVPCLKNEFGVKKHV